MDAGFRAFDKNGFNGYTSIANSTDCVNIGLRYDSTICYNYETLEWIQGVTDRWNDGEIVLMVLNTVSCSVTFNVRGKLDTMAFGKGSMIYREISWPLQIAVSVARGGQLELLDGLCVYRRPNRTLCNKSRYEYEKKTSHKCNSGIKSQV